MQRSINQYAANKSGTWIERLVTLVNILIVYIAHNLPDTMSHDNSAIALASSELAMAAFFFIRSTIAYTPI